jgi:hypothetical protein
VSGTRGRPRTHGHGTEARARKHYRDGEKPCPACREALASACWWREQERKRRQLVARMQAALDAVWASLEADGWRWPV